MICVITCPWLEGQPINFLRCNPLRPAHARRQLEAEVGEQLRHAGIVQDPCQRLPDTLPRSCSTALQLPPTQQRILLGAVQKALSTNQRNLRALTGAFTSPEPPNFMPFQSLQP